MSSQHQLDIQSIIMQRKETVPNFKNMHKKIVYRHLNLKMIYYNEVATASKIFRYLRTDTPYIFEVFVREEYTEPAPFNMFDISEQIRVITRGDTITLPSRYSTDMLYEAVDEFCENNPTVMVKQGSKIIWEAEKSNGNRVVIK